MHLNGSCGYVLFSGELDCKDWMSFRRIVITHPLTMAKALDYSSTEHLTEVFERYIAQMKLTTAAGTREWQAGTALEIEMQIAINHVRVDNLLTTDERVGLFYRADDGTVDMDHREPIRRTRRVWMVGVHVSAPVDRDRSSLAVIVPCQIGE
jgi:hypothetical protein